MMQTTVRRSAQWTLVKEVSSQAGMAGTVWQKMDKSLQFSLGNFWLQGRKSYVDAYKIVRSQIRKVDTQKFLKISPDEASRIDLFLKDTQDRIADEGVGFFAQRSWKISRGREELLTIQPAPCKMGLVVSGVCAPFVCLKPQEQGNFHLQQEGIKSKTENLHSFLSPWVQTAQYLRGWHVADIETSYETEALKGQTD